MSLADPNDEYSELVPAGAGKVGKFAKKARFYIIILIIGILIGAYVQFAYITPLMTQGELNSCSDCTRTKELLGKENNCLYSLLQNPNAASKQCSTNTEQITQQTPQDSIQDTNFIAPDNNTILSDSNSGKDFNEEPAI